MWNIFWNTVGIILFLVTLASIVKFAINLYGSIKIKTQAVNNN
ncbi:MAG: hypothetical protein Q4F85_15995 [Prevotella sp.]|jgi:hypothetical protein|nr:hypothetical protein [Prevotella sp.]